MKERIIGRSIEQLERVRVRKIESKGQTFRSIITKKDLAREWLDPFGCCSLIG